MLLFSLGRLVSLGKYLVRYQTTINRGLGKLGNIFLQKLFRKNYFSFVGKIPFF